MTRFLAPVGRYLPDLPDTATDEASLVSAALAEIGHGTALPNEWRWDIMRFLPDAANQVVSVTIGNNAPPHLWSAWPQLGVTALWAAALLAAGAYLFRKRDA